MARIGMFCLPWTGHLNPFAALADELERRGHEIIFFHLPDFGEQVRSRGFRFEAYGDGDGGQFALEERSRGFSKLSGLAASRAALDILTSQAEALFTAAPEIIERAKLDLWVVDHLDYAASTLAACMEKPFVSLIVTLMRHDEDGVPGFSGEIDLSDSEATERDRLANERMLEASRPFREFLSAYRVREGMSPFRFATLWSELAQISQQPVEFEYPRKRLPRCFHFTGPFIRAERRPGVEFELSRRPNRPLIYASFGTAQNGNAYPYECVARAAEGIDADFVLSKGGVSVDALPSDLPLNVTAARSVPQLEVLQQADLMVTHAGMNSTLECLASGVPMVAIPIAHDQPGISARIVRSGTGVRLLLHECGPDRLRAAIVEVLAEPSYREAARRFQKLIAERDGLNQATGIIERVLSTGQAVSREE